MKLYLQSLLMIVFAVILCVSFARAARLAPRFTSAPCPGPNGGWFSMVEEDRDGDGVYDWETRIDCDGSTCSGPKLATHPLDTINHVRHGSFSSQICVDEVDYGWHLELYDSDDVFLASFTRVCGDSMPTITYPPLGKSSCIDSKNLCKNIQNSEMTFVPNPANQVVTLTFNTSVSAKAVVRILNTNGGTVHQSESVECQAGKNTLTFPFTSSFSDGVYTCWVSLDNGNQLVGKLVVAQ